jgi:hypothetical protein
MESLARVGGRRRSLFLNKHIPDPRFFAVAIQMSLNRKADPDLGSRGAESSRQGLEAMPARPSGTGNWRRQQRCELIVNVQLRRGDHEKLVAHRQNSIRNKLFESVVNLL